MKNSKKYSDLYRIEKVEASKLLIKEQGFSTRLETRLLSNRYYNIGDLLEESDGSLSRINGFGDKCLEELNHCLRVIENKGKKGNESFELSDMREINGGESFKRQREINSKLVQEHIEAIKKADYSFLNPNNKDDLEFIKSLEILGPKLLTEAICNSHFIRSLYYTLEDYTNTIESEKFYEEQIKQIPDYLLIKKARRIFRLFNKSNKGSSFLELLVPITPEVTLGEYLLENKKLFADDKESVLNLMNWLKRDLLSEYKKFRANYIEKSYFEEILKSRCSGMKITEIGKNLNITRQRVSQVDTSYRQKFKVWNRNNSFIKFLFLICGTPDLLEEKDLSYIFHEYSTEVAYFMKYSGIESKKINGKVFYFFSSEGIQFLLDYIKNEIPDITPLTKIENYKARISTNLSKQYGYSDKTIEILIEELFKEHFTFGKEFIYKKKLSKKNIIEEILRNKYPEGIEIYKEEEVEILKKIIYDEFKLDLTSNSSQSIQAKVINNKNFYLCDRGKYIHKDFLTPLTDETYSKIEDYIESNNRPMILSDTLFSIFEKELKAQNVRNKYRLLSLIKIRFGDRWFYRRDCISKNAENLSIYDGILEYVKSSPVPVRKEQLKKEFPGVTEIVMSFALNSPYILNLYGSYLHTDYLKVSEEDKEWLIMLISNTLEGKELISTRLIYNKILEEYPLLLSRNYIKSKAGIFDFIKCLCGNEFYYFKPYISKKPIKFNNSTEPIVDMITENERIDIEEVISTCREEEYQLNNILNILNSCNRTHFLFNSKEIGRIDLTGIDKKIAQEVEKLIYEELMQENKTKPINQLSCIYFLPEIKITWSDWLLYSLLLKYSDKLEVAPSYSQFRSAVPLVSIKNRMNIEEYYATDLKPLDEIKIYSHKQDLEDVLAELVDDLEWGEEIEF